MKLPSFLLNQTVILKAYLGTDSVGQQVYGTIDTLDQSSIVSFDTVSGEYVIKCRFEPTVASNRQTNKETPEYTATLYVNGSFIPPQSKVIYNGEKYIVQNCIERFAMSSRSHIEVMLK